MAQAMASRAALRAVRRAVRRPRAGRATPLPAATVPARPAAAAAALMRPRAALSGKPPSAAAQAEAAKKETAAEAGQAAPQEGTADQETSSVKAEQAAPQEERKAEEEEKEEERQQGGWRDWREWSGYSKARARWRRLSKKRRFVIGFGAFTAYQFYGGFRGGSYRYAAFCQGEEQGEEGEAQGGAADGREPVLTLYQYEVCPFCCKVKAYLNYHGVPYRLVEVDPLLRTELDFSKDYKKVPVAVLRDGTQVNNSNDIIRAINAAAREHGTRDFCDITERDERWLSWVDDRLVRLLPPNIYRTPTEALEAFGYISEHGQFQAWQRAAIKYLGAGAMYVVAHKKKREYGIKDERAALTGALADWTAAMEGRPFLGGEQPGAADLAVFGVLSSVRPLTVWGDVRAAVPEAHEWYTRVEDLSRASQAQVA